MKKKNGHPEIIKTKTAGETLEQGEKLGRALKPGDFVGLTGDLGAGKTVFTKGIAKGLGLADYTHVNSPTFVIIKEYGGRVPLYHFDVYRLDDESALLTVGYQEYFYGRGVTVVEWADKIKSIIPDKRIDVLIKHAGGDKRVIEIKKAV